jgi:hypothetical protein
VLGWLSKREEKKKSEKPRDDNKRWDGSAAGKHGDEYGGESDAEGRADG